MQLQMYPGEISITMKTSEWLILVGVIATIPKDESGMTEKLVDKITASIA